MRSYIEKFIKELEYKLKIKHTFTPNEKVNIKNKIVFFQHERLIHLLVTLFYAIFTIAFLALGMISFIFAIPFFAMIIFLIFYIRHYFFLENAIQYLYILYDKIMSK